MPILLLLLTALGATKPFLHHTKLRQLLSAGDPKAIESYFDAQKERYYGVDNAVLYYMDRAISLQHLGQHADVGEMVRRAADRLDAPTAPAAFVPQDYERGLLFVLGAVSSAVRGKADDAIIDARQADEVLFRLNDKRAKTGKGNSYAADPFVRWMLGTLYESTPETARDALGAYQKATLAYDALFGAATRPRVLASDVGRAGKNEAGLATIVFVHLNGEVGMPRHITSAEVRIGDARSLVEVFDDVDAIAAKSASDRAARGEKAPAKSWGLLPATIGGAKVQVPAGDLLVNVAYSDASGKVVLERSLPRVTAAAGATVFLVDRTF